MQPPTSASWYMQPDEGTALRKRLAAAHRDLLHEAERVAPEHWNYSPRPQEQWSPSQIAEHVFLAERVLRDQVRMHLGDEPRPDLLPTMQDRADLLMRVLPGGGKAPAGKQSTAFSGFRLEDLATVISGAEAQYDLLLDEAKASPVKAICWKSPFFGELSAYLWLLYVPLHTARHVGQLARCGAA